jgi:phosphoglycerate kinase
MAEGSVVNKLTVEDMDLRNKRVFIRVDFNVPMDDNMVITDDRRIRSSLPTINYCIDEGARVILASHLGRPKGKPNPKYSLAMVAKRLQRLLNKEVTFVSDCVGSEAQQAVEKMKAGDVIVLENLRFHEGEEKNEQSFAKKLAALADCFLNDAFGASHRAHASIVGIAGILPAGAGFLLKKEIEYLQGMVSSPVRPFVAVLGGAKVSGKIGVLDNLSDKVDKVIVGGGMAFTFIKAMGHDVGDSIVETEMLDLAGRIMETLRKNNVKFYLPVDCVIAQSLDLGAETKIVPTPEIHKGWRGLDIGPASSRLFSEVLQNAKTVMARRGRCLRAHDSGRRGHGPCGAQGRGLGLHKLYLNRRGCLAPAAGGKAAPGP